MTFWNGAGGMPDPAGSESKLRSHEIVHAHLRICGRRELAPFIHRWGIIFLVCWVACIACAHGSSEPKTPQPHDERVSEERKTPKTETRAPGDRVPPPVVAPPPGYGNKVVHRRDVSEEERRQDASAR